MVSVARELTFGTNATDWQEGIHTVRMREARIARARQVMQSHGIAAMLVTRGDNGRYLTGLRGPEFFPQLWYVLFFAEGEPIVFANAGWLSQLPNLAPWIKHWRLARSWMGGAPGFLAVQEEAKQFASEIQQQLREKGIIGEKLAIIGFDSPARQALSELGIRLDDGWPIMLEARAIKTLDEINCLKMVATITEAAWYKVWEALRPGVRDTELFRIAVQALYEAGAEEVPPITVFSGPLSFDGGPSRTGRIIQSGDLVAVLMCGVSYMGYRSCTHRTFMAGRSPNAKEKDWYKKLLDRIDAVIDAIKPGATTTDAAKHFLPAATWGYREEAQVLTLECGHGIGLYSPEFPIINRQWSLKYPQVIEPGMTIAVEGREGEPGVGGVWLENMLAVTESGAEIIDHMPRNIILEPMA